MSCPSFATITDGSPAGLTAAEAQRRLREFGPNATPEEPARPLRLFASKFLAPVPCLLEAAIVLQLVLGEYVQASIIAVLLVFNTALGFLHESRAQATIAALKSRLALNASVRRDGEWKTIPAAELVAGDLIKLSLGSVVAADASLVQGFVLLDQSMLTGNRCRSRPKRAMKPMPAPWSGAAKLLPGDSDWFAHEVRPDRRTCPHRLCRQHAAKADFSGRTQSAGLMAPSRCTLMILRVSKSACRSPNAIPLVLVSVLASIPVALPANLFWRPPSERGPLQARAYFRPASRRSTKPQAWMSCVSTRPGH